MHLHTGSLSKAASAFRQAIRLNPDNPSYHYLLADTYRRMGMVKHAAAHYRKAGRLGAYDSAFVRRVRDEVSRSRE
jgi:cytochrome c-type biogenesis protein CcmH/NrfG